MAGKIYYWTILVVTFLTLNTTPANSAKILAFFPLDLYSHDVPFFNVFDELVRRGHEVTLVSNFGLRHTSPSLYKHILLPSIMKTGNQSSFSFNPMSLNDNIFGSVRRFNKMCLRVLQYLHTPQIKDFIQNHRGDYDVIISEVTFCGHIHAALAHKYSAPLINYHPLGYEAGAFSLLGGLAPPCAAVDVRLPFTDQQVDFWHRMEIFFMSLCDMWDLYMNYLPEVEKLMSVYKYPGWESRPPLLTLIYNISLTLVEHDPHIIGLSFPVPPNMILAGGLHLRPAMPLPAHLERFMRAPGKKGVIFVCIGTILKFSHFPRDLVDAYAKVLSNLDYNVIWNVDVNVTVSDNVMTGTWFPQEDILGHPNCKLFLTHGGIHSTMETVYYAVPVLILPGFSDQFQNAQMMQEKGIGLVTLAQTITKESLSKNIQEVLTNPKYRLTVQRLSAQAHSMPYRNLGTAADWIEYVAVNQGAPGLSPEVRKSSVWHTLGFDLILIGIIVLLLLIIVVILVVCCFVCLCRRSCKKK